MPKIVWSKEKVISELRRHRENGPKMHPQLDDAARRHFGSLRAALKVAGLPCGKRPPPYESWTRDSVIEAIRERKRNGHSLQRARRESSTLYSAGKRLFGNWSAACAAAGYPRATRDHYTPDEVRLRIIDLYERQLPLRFNATSDPKLRRSVRMHFGSWRRAVESMGLASEIRQVWTKQKVVDAILQRRAAALCLYTTRKEDPRLFCAAVSQFGTWHNALEAAGISARVREIWNHDKVLERLRQLTRQSPGVSVYKLDSALAYAAVRRFGSVKEAIEAAKRLTRSNDSRCAQ